MEKATICGYPHSDQALSHYKCILQCCVKYPCVNIPDQETYDRYSNMTPSIRFHIFYIIANCAAHIKLTLNDKIIVACVSRILIQNISQKFTLERASDDGEKIFYFSFKFLY